jgi:lysozyme
MDLALMRKELIADEGLKLTSYQDTRGFWTIGVGHLLGKERRMLTITLDEAMALLDWDIDLAFKIVVKAVPMINMGSYSREYEVRLRALVNMAFNRGNNMITSTTITPAIVKAEDLNDWTHVREVIMASPWAAQLPFRAARLAAMLETGVAPA